MFYIESGLEILWHILTDENNGVYITSIYDCVSKYDLEKANVRPNSRLKSTDGIFTKSSILYIHEICFEPHFAMVTIATRHNILAIWSPLAIKIASRQF